jgi:RNA polymerase sigma factor (sigma-70 family)
LHSDQRYIEALRHNDPAAIRDIFRLHAGPAIRWVTQHGGSRDDAEDVFQEALVAVFEKAQKPDFVLTCPLGALLHVIYSRKWIDRLRQKKRDAAVRNAEERRYESEPVEQDALTLAEEAIAEQTRQDKLGKAFAQISELCQRLLTLLSNGTSPREAAQLLQMNSTDTLFRRKHACVTRWREIYLAMK